MPATIAGSHLGADVHGSRPAANAAGQPIGALYSCTTHSLVYKTDGSTWSTWANLAGTGLADPMTTRGDAIFRNASNVSARLPLGAAGKVPTSDGTDLAYAYPGHVLLEQHSASSSAALDFTTGITAAFDEYLVEMLNLVPATDAVDLRLRMSTDGGSSYDSGLNYGSVGAYFYTGGTGVITSNDTGTEITMIDTVDNSANYGVCGSFRLFQPASTALYKMVVGEAMMQHGTLSKILGDKFVGVYRSATAVNAFRILFSSGNIASGIVRLYGIAK